MNCKPDDLARFIDTPGARLFGLVDKIIRVTVCFKSEGLDFWYYEGPTIECGCGCGAWLKSVADDALRPIRGGEGDDETLTWAPVPGQKETAPA